MTSFTPHTRDLIQVLSGYGKLILMLIALSLGTATNDLNASPEEDVKTVAALDTKYQAAVKSNDAATMDQILADDFILVTGRGKVSSKADLIESARKKEVIYDRQDEEPGTQKVRVWGDTAVVTALLWIKAVQQGGGPGKRHLFLWYTRRRSRSPGYNGGGCQSLGDTAFRGLGSGRPWSIVRGATFANNRSGCAGELLTAQGSGRSGRFITDF